MKKSQSFRASRTIKVIWFCFFRHTNTTTVQPHTTILTKQHESFIIILHKKSERKTKIIFIAIVN